MHLSRLARFSALPFLLISALSLSGCGYSQEEWDQKLRENEKLAADLKAQREANKKAQTDNAEAVKEIEDLKKQLTELQAQHTGQSIEQIELDSDRDRWFTPQQAMDYGFIDKVITQASEAADEGRPARQ